MPFEVEPGKRRKKRQMNADRLLERIAQGDLPAFESLYDDHILLVYGIALRILKNETAAEDLAQGVFLKIFASPRAFRPGNFAAWITRVTRNRALDELRRSSKTAELSDFALGTNEEPLEEQVIAHVDAQRARTIMTSLPTEQRTTLELAFFDGLTHNEIASMTGTPLGTVKTRIRSGLLAIRSALNMSMVQ